MTKKQPPTTTTKLSDDIFKKTHFTRLEVEGLMAFYHKQTNAKLDRNKFRNVLHNTFNITDDLLMDRLFSTFDIDADNHIGPEDWVLSMSVYLLGTLDEKIRFCFNVYDINGDSFISRDEMFNMLKSSIMRQPTDEDPDEGIKDLVEITLKMFHEKAESKVSLDDFRKTVEKEPLLLEAFGQCLPDERSKQCFLATFSQSVKA